MMKVIKKLIPLSLLLFSNCLIYGQGNIEYVEKKNVLTVIESYKNALQNLTTKGTFELFTDDALFYEQDKVEGTYTDYIDNHLGPELGHFKSFTFSDYSVNVSVNLPYAYTTEDYSLAYIL